MIPYKLEYNVTPGFYCENIIKMRKCFETKLSMSFISEGFKLNEVKIELLRNNKFKYNTLNIILGIFINTIKLANRTHRNHLLHIYF
jgi:hypothetical protein